MLAKILISLLIIIAILMIVLSIKNVILAPGLTGIGFIIIAILIKTRGEK